MKIQQSCAVVTGGASGLGEATVRNIVEKGGKALVLDLSEEKGKRLQKELAESVLFVKADVTSEEDVLLALDRGIEKLGAINTAVNCAGIAIAQKVLSRKGVHSLDHFSKVISINLIGSFNVIRIAAERMVTNAPNEEGERGVIINTASVAAFEGQIGQAANSASKGGVAGMTLPLHANLQQESE